MRVVVVGAGLGGLSAAAHLVGRGHEVIVLEREAVPGGRAGLWESGGYRFDTGPTVLTMTALMEQTFAAAGARMSDHLKLKIVDPMYRACFPDGSELRVRHGQEAMTTEIREVCGADEAAAFERFCTWLRRLYELEMPNFIERNYDTPLDLAWPPGPAVALAFMGGFRRLDHTVASYFNDYRLRQIFSFQSMYAGLSPYEALAIYCVITYMDAVEGVFFPEGGIHALPRGLAAAIEAAGGTMQYGAEVERILRRPGRRGVVTGVRLTSGDTVDADAVVVNADLPGAYRRFLPELPPPRLARPGAGHYSPSCVLWLVGSRGQLPEGAAHHNIHFGQDWKGAFTALMHHGTRMPDPSILVTSPTISDPTLAPPERNSLYVLEPVPNLTGQVDWQYEWERMRDDLGQRVSALGYPVHASDIDVEWFIDPMDWERMGMEQGTPFSLSHRFFQTGPFRPKNVDKRAPGLVFVGSGTVPGVSVPMVLVSGRLAADRVDAIRG